MKKKTYLKLFITLILLTVSIVYIYYDDTNKKEKTLNNNIEKKVINENEITKINNNSNLIIYFIDVGQADSILINYSDKYMLVDAGNNNDGKKLVSYFKQLGINSFDYVFGTHAHEDHIGGMDDIIKNFEINNFYMPDTITTTKTFTDIIDALENKNIKFNVPNINDNYNLGDLNIKVLYLSNDETDLNDNSIVLKLSYYNKSIILMGDASTKVEKKLLKEDIKSDVIKIGHHGSSYSTSQTFLEKVNPEYAIISVGKDNKYNHPNDYTIKKIENMNIKIYRTDIDKTIILKTDGNNISFEFLNTDTNG